MKCTFKCMYLSSCQVLIRARGRALEVLPINEGLDSFFDIRLHLKHKPVLTLLVTISYQKLLRAASKLLVLTWPTGKRSWAANSPSNRLWLRVFRIFMIRTMAASIWWKRSWSTCSLVFLLSSSLSLHANNRVGQIQCTSIPSQQ